MSQLGERDYCQLEGGGQECYAAERSTIYMTAPTTKNDPEQNANSAKIENFWSSLIVHAAPFGSELSVGRLNGFKFYSLYKGKIIIDGISIAFILLSHDCSLTNTIYSILF